MTTSVIKALFERFGITSAFIASLLVLAPSNFSFADNPPVKICVLAKRGIVRCMEKWSPTAQYLTSKIPGKIFVIVPIDSDGAFSFVEHGAVDFVLANPSVYVELESMFGINRIATLKNLRLDGAHTKYCGVIFCRTNRSDIQYLSDLKGKTFMGVKESSFGGWRMAWREFIENDINPYRDFKDLRFGGTHDTVVYAVRDGEVDVGTVRTDTLETMEIEGKISLADFRVIHEHEGGIVHLPFLHSTRSYPEWPLAKVKHTPDELAEKVATALLEMPKDSSAAKAARCAGWTIPHNYQSVHECLKKLKVGPYKDLGKITLADVFNKYWGAILVIIFFFLLVVGAVFFILKLNRGIKKSHAKLQQEVEERKQVEVALRESEERFKDISYSMADWIWEVDRDGKYTFTSASVKEILGYDPEELIGKTPFELMPEDEKKRIGEAFKIIACEKKPIVDLENWNLTKDGKRVCLLTNGVPILNDKGGLCGYRGVDKDITEKKKARDALKESEEKYRTLVESSTDAILMMDKERHIASCNQAFCNLFGYRKDEVVGKSIRIIHTSDHAFDSFGETAYPIINEHGYFRTEWEFMRKNGTVVPVETVTSPVRSADGTIEGYIAMIRNFTERKQAEEERILLATAIEQAAESVVITDKDGNIQYVNPSFETITGYSHQEAIDKNPRILKSDKHTKEFYKDMWNTITSGRVWSGHLINKRKDGTFYEEEATISPVKNKSGEVINFVAVKRDMTEEIKLEGKLRQAQKMEAIGTLAGGIAHDFNNILSAIIGYTELAEYGMSEGSKTRKNLREVLNAGRRARDLVKQILAFSRQGEQERKPLQMSHIIKEALKLLRASLPTTIEIRRFIEPDTAIIEADPTQIHQLMMNLCTNAAHAMNNNGGVLEVGIRNVEVGNDDRGSEYPKMPPGPYVMLTVRDTGHGMSVEVLDRIFDPYFTTKEKGEGTGLGLAVVHGIVKSYGGAITVYSEVGKGSTFNIYFPAIKKKVAQKEEKPEVISIGRQRILFVDDELALVDIGKKMLENLGHEIITRTSSLEALEAFRSSPDRFDLVITDKTMPQMTGFDLAKEIKRIRPDIPIILCTGFSDTTDMDKAKAVGISGLIMKPIVRSEMAESIKRALELE